MRKFLRKGIALASMMAACTKPQSDVKQSDSPRTAIAAAAAAATTTPGNVVQVIGLDYAFKMPDTLNAGRTAFKFVNNGKVDHEYNVGLLKVGATLQQFIAAANANKPVAEFVDGPVGVLFAKPGQSSPSTLSVELLPGRVYVVQCINQDSATAPTHRALGMFKSIEVRTVPPLHAIAVVSDTIVGVDYAYSQYPKTLAAGVHHFVFVNAGKQRHEINLVLLKPSVTMQQLLAVARKGGNMDPIIDEALGVLHSAGGVTPSGTLDVNVMANRQYAIVCTFSDTEKSAPHFAMGMIAGVRSGM